MPTVAEQLKDLAELLEKGLLTRDQFEVQRDQLLAESQSGAAPTSSSTTVTPAVTDDLTGQRIGEYRLDRKLGEGGMGAVYKASHTSLDQQVAVKVLDPALARSPEVRERFLQEANIQLRLQHPGIVRVLTASTEGPHLALVMEYVDGLSLAQVIERRRALPVDDAHGLFRQVLAAVGVAHSRGVVHRDIKPSNIMVQADGTARVMDFGIAKVVGGQKLTRTGTVMGSAHYMSPEQIVGSKDVDHRTDIYSLGITFYEVLTERTPFEGMEGDSTDADFMIKLAHKEQPPPDPRSLRGDLPREVSEGLLKALAKAPRERFGSCEEFAGALVRPMERAPVPAPMEAPPVRPEPAAPPRPRIAPALDDGLMLIEAGEFQMGSPETEEGRGTDERLHTVTISRPFRIGSTPVTQAQWEAVMGTNPSFIKGSGHPVECVSWFDAVEFCNKLSEAEGRRPAYDWLDKQEGWWVFKEIVRDVRWDRTANGYRLPTEAEWEYAARAGGSHVFAGSDNVHSVAWCDADSDGRTHTVGQKQPNAWGLHDMSGNVWEWVWDWKGRYPTRTVTDPTGPTSGVCRGVRGGGWRDSAHGVRCANRNWDLPVNRWINRGGFRVVLPLPC